MEKKPFLHTLKERANLPMALFAIVFLFNLDSLGYGFANVFSALRSLRPMGIISAVLQLFTIFVPVLFVFALWLVRENQQKAVKIAIVTTMVYLVAGVHSLISMALNIVKNIQLLSVTYAPVLRTVLSVLVLLWLLKALHAGNAGTGVYKAVVLARMVLNVILSANMLVSGNIIGWIVYIFVEIVWAWVLLLLPLAFISPDAESLKLNKAKGLAIVAGALCFVLLVSSILINAGDSDRGDYDYSYDDDYGYDDDYDFSDYLKDNDPDLYDTIVDRYNTVTGQN